MKKLIAPLFLILIAGCGNESSYKSPALNASPPGSLYFKTVGLQQSSSMFCKIYFDIENRGSQTYQMTIWPLYRTLQGQVIESSMQVVTVRGGQTVTDNGMVQENCNIVGSMQITKVSTCQVDGQFVDDDVCWRAINISPGPVQLTK